jgi:hypothetical protein
MDWSDRSGCYCANMIIVVRIVASEGAKNAIAG